MVLEHLGVVKTESELRALADTSDIFGGTNALHIVDTAKELGFPEAAKYNLSLQELLFALQQGFFPIVYIAIRLMPNTPLQTHSVVVVEINERGVLILDPVRGEVIHTVDEFNEMWEKRRWLTILIK